MCTSEVNLHISYGNSLTLCIVWAIRHASALAYPDEGVEDAHCLGLLTGLRCDLVQGYVISKPQPADQLELTPHVLPAVAPRRAA